MGLLLTWQGLRKYVGEGISEAFIRGLVDDGLIKKVPRGNGGKFYYSRASVDRAMKAIEV